MRLRFVALVVLSSAVAAARSLDDRPLREPGPPTQELPWRNHVVPVLETVALNFSLLAFNNLVTHMPFAQVSGESLLRNLRPASWTFDVDYYVTNQFGHPYQGALTFNAARSAGVSFWWSTLYAALGSLAWELFFEVEAPSVNDEITTPIGGALLGEALHRAALQLRDLEPRWLSALGAALLDPLGALNGLLLEQPAVTDVTLDPLIVRWQAGAIASVVVDRVTSGRYRSPAQAHVGVLLISGPPWDPRSTYDAPLSYFDLAADLSFPSKVVGNVFIRGLLRGQRVEAGSLRGVWGVFGEYDYAAPEVVRASAVGLGPGIILQVQAASRLYLQAGGVLALSPFAAAGQLLEVSPDLGRDYHVGPGLQTLVDLRLLRPEWFQLELVARNWVVFGAYTPPNGFESITHLTVAVSVPVWRWVGVGAEFTLSDRRARFTDDGAVHDTGGALRLTVRFMSDPLFGVREPR